MKERILSDHMKEKDESDKGLTCPGCGCRHWSVIYVRYKRDLIVRRRECRNCGRRILTYEKTTAEPTVKGEHDA